jgi:hypothetical protein
MFFFGTSWLIYSPQPNIEIGANTKLLHYNAITTPFVPEPKML